MACGMTGGKIHAASTINESYLHWGGETRMRAHKLHFQIVINQCGNVTYYLVNAVLVFQPGEVHLFHIAGVTGQRCGSRRGHGGAAPSVHAASSRACSTPAQPLSPPDTPTPQDTRKHPKLTHGYGDTIKRRIGKKVAFDAHSSEFAQTPDSSKLNQTCTNAVAPRGMCRVCIAPWNCDRGLLFWLNVKKQM